MPRTRHSSASKSGASGESDFGRAAMAASYVRLASARCPVVNSTTQRASARRGCLAVMSGVSNWYADCRRPMPSRSHRRIAPASSRILAVSSVASALAAWRMAVTVSPRRASASAILRCSERNRPGVSCRYRLLQCSRISGCSRRVSAPSTRTDSRSPATAEMPSRRRIRSWPSSTSSSRAPSMRPNSPTSSRNCRSSAPSPRQSRDSIQFPATSRSSTLPTFVAAARSLWTIRSAMGHPPDSRASASSSPLDSPAPRKPAISSEENRSWLASKSAVLPDSTDEPMSSATGSSRQAMAKDRFGGPHCSSVFTSASDSASAMRSSSSSTRTQGAPCRAIAWRRLSIRLPVVPPPESAAPPSTFRPAS